jgi:acetyl esterase
MTPLPFLSHLPMALRARAITIGAEVLSTLRYALPDARPRRFAVEVHPNRVYGEKTAHHRLDVYVPTRAERPLATVMYVHGGGFTMLSKNTHRVMALSLARRGFLVFNVDYRLGPRHRYPAQLQDTAQALLYVRDTAARYGGDPERIGLAGESAGANLVTALALATSHRFDDAFARTLFDSGITLRGVAATYGFHDLTDIDGYLARAKIASWAREIIRGSAHGYVGKDVRRAAREAPLTSPLLLLESDRVFTRPLPPFFIDAGTKDPLLDQSRRLAHALDVRKVPCEFHLMPGEIHGYDAMVWRPAAQAKWRAVSAFFRRNMRPEVSLKVPA